MTRLTIRRPDDWHIHLRDGALMAGIVGCTASHIGRAIVMPNLVPPVLTSADAAAYRDRILSNLPSDTTFKPQMTLYLTESTDLEDMAAGAAAGTITAMKLYPAGATTNSDNGVRDWESAIPVFERMAEIGLPLCLHGEVTDDDVDIFDREAAFIDTVLEPMRRRVPGLRVIMEHLTTKEAVDYVASVEEGLAGTITTHHLIINRNDILLSGLKPHYYCMPIAKGREHQLALRAAATSGDPRYFSGTDSAPHVDAAKESNSASAGCFTALNSLSTLAQVFEEEGALDRFEAFVSLHGAAYYRQAPAEDHVTLVRSDTPVVYPAKVETDAGSVTVFDPGFPVHWQIEGLQ